MIFILTYKDGSLKNPRRVKKELEALGCSVVLMPVESTNDLVVQSYRPAIMPETNGCPEENS